MVATPMDAPLDSSGGRPRRLRRLAFRLALSLALGLISLELLLRFLLIGSSDLALRLGEPLRRPELFSDPHAGEDYWKLRARFDRAPPAEPHPLFHPLLGWCKLAVDPQTYRHRFEVYLRGRAPLLFFGDSFTACLTGPEECWEGLLERSEFGRELCILNYGTGSYGLDQILLLLRSALPAYAEARPRVVVGILVDDDLDRAMTGLREYPKPRFELEGDELVLRPPERAPPLAYAMEHPLGGTSYLWRFFVFGSELVPPARRGSWMLDAGFRAREEALGRRLLQEIQRAAAPLDPGFFVILFHGEEALAASEIPWQERFLEQALHELAIPFVSSRRELAADAARTGRTPGSYFLRDGKDVHHYPAETNAIVFGTLARGLRREFERRGHSGSASGR